MKSAATDPSKANSQLQPRGVLASLTAICFLAFTPLAIYCWRQAWLDWHTVPAEGVVADIRIAFIKRPAPRAAGPWRVVWEVERGPEMPGRVSVYAVGSYSSEAGAREASRHDRGRRVTVWQVPWDEGMGELRPPDWTRGIIGAIWTTAMAAMGWLGVAAFIQLGWRKWRQGGSAT